MVTKPTAPVDLTNPDVRAQMKQWVEQWKRIAPVLDAERTAALQAMTEADAARIAVEIVWPIGTLGEYRGGDDGAGLEAIVRLQRRAAAR